MSTGDFVVFSVSVPDILHNGLPCFKQQNLNTEAFTNK